MKMKAGILFLALIAADAMGEPTTPHLVVDADGHTAAVNKVCFVDDERLASVSNDKTVRIWSIRGGDAVAVIRPPIGPGSAGMLYALDVSPNGRWLAAGGFEYAGEDHGVYLIDLVDQTISEILRGHTNVIIDVAFSPDGRWLASSSVDKTVRVWEMAGRRCVATARGHRDAVYAVAFSPDSNRMATASLDKTARVWSVPSGEQLQQLPAHAAPLQAVAWSSDSSTLATGGGDGTISLWSRDGDLLRRFEGLGNQVTSLQYSAAGDQLFFTLGGAGQPDGGFFIDLSQNRAGTRFTTHENSVLDGATSPSGKLAATADANGEICVWRVADGSLVRRFKGRGSRPWSVAWEPRTDAIAWGTNSHFGNLNARGPVEVAFSLSDLEFVALPESQLKQAQTRLGNITAEPVDGRILSVMRSGRDPIQLQLPSSRDEVRCFTILDERHVAVGSDFGLYVWDVFDEQHPRQLRGHEGAIWALAPSIDSRYLLSAGEDQTLRTWDWKRGELLVSLFFADRQWIAWTPQGYYAASPGGERLMGWHVDGAPGTLADFYSAAQFRDSLYRPDIVRRVLAEGSVEAAIESLSDSTLPPVVVSSVEEVLPPLVDITQPAASPFQTDQAQVSIRAIARSRSEHPITALRLLLDGRPYEGLKGVHVVPSNERSRDPSSGEWTVDLSTGRHTLIVQAETTVSKGLSAPLEVEVRPPAAEPEEVRLPDLYVLAIGIQAYPGPLRLNYAANDAKSIATTFQKVGKPLFREIDVQLLTDQEATRRQILSGLSWLRREMTQRDVAIFFFSGHGARDETGAFHLVPVDGDPEDLLSTGIVASQFKDALAAIPGRVLVLLDACHAGAAGGDRRKAVYVMADDLIRDLATDDYGVIVMCSSMGREYSMESDRHQQGYFTVALLEALNGKADTNQDQLVYLTEIDAYIADRVKTLTDGMQHPVTSKPTTIRSFPISKPGVSGP
jgi:WD40 repeat protein